MYFAHNLPGTCQCGQMWSSVVRLQCLFIDAIHPQNNNSGIFTQKAFVSHCVIRFTFKIVMMNFSNVQLRHWLYKSYFFNTTLGNVQHYHLLQMIQTKIRGQQKITIDNSLRWKSKIPSWRKRITKIPTQRQITRRISRHLLFHDSNQSCQYSISDRNISQWYPRRFPVVSETCRRGQEKWNQCGDFGGYLYSLPIFAGPRTSSLHLGILDFIFHPHIHSPNMYVQYTKVIQNMCAHPGWSRGRPKIQIVHFHAISGENWAHDNVGAPSEKSWIRHCIFYKYKVGLSLLITSIVMRIMTFHQSILFVLDSHKCIPWSVVISLILLIVPLATDLISVLFASGNSSQYFVLITRLLKKSWEKRGCMMIVYEFSVFCKYLHHFVINSELSSNAIDEWIFHEKLFSQVLE